MHTFRIAGARLQYAFNVVFYSNWLDEAMGAPLVRAVTLSRHGRDIGTGAPRLLMTVTPPLGM